MCDSSQNDKLRLVPFTLHSKLMYEVVPKLAYSKGDVQTWRKEAKEKLVELLGLDNMPTERCELNIRSIWKREHPLGTIEKIVFAVEESCDANAYVCLPKNAVAPYPFFICLQGHSTGAHNSVALALEDETKTIKIEGDRDFAFGCMERGIACVCLEQRGFGEREDAYKGTPRCQPPATHALMLGRTLLGERVYDVDRTIDYILSRDDSDSARIGVMGNSGGGTASMFAGAVLDRLTHVMPSCSFSSFKESIMSIEHCVCNYVPHLLRWFEVGDVVALCAPRPLVVVNGGDDPIFPIQAARDEFGTIQRVYDQLGAGDKCHHVVCDGGHRFYAQAAWDVMRKHL